MRSLTQGRRSARAMGDAPAKVVWNAVRDLGVAAHATRPRLRG